MKVTDAMRRAVMLEFQRKGASKGGKAVADALTPEERKEKARKAGIASGKARKGNVR